MRDFDDPAVTQAKDPVTLATREAAPPLAAEPEPFAPLGISGGVRGLQRAVGNRATQRLLKSSAARSALSRGTRRSGRVLSRQDDESVSVTRDFTLPPFLHSMEASAEREYDQPPGTVPDFSGDTPANTLTSLDSGDHVWYWTGTRRQPGRSHATTGSPATLRTRSTTRATAGRSTTSSSTRTMSSAASLR